MTTFDAGQKLNPGKEYDRARRFTYYLLLIIHIFIGAFCGALVMGGPVATDTHRHHEEFASTLEWHNAILTWGFYGMIFGAAVTAVCFLLVAGIRVAFLMPIFLTAAFSLMRYCIFFVINNCSLDDGGLPGSLINLCLCSCVGVPAGVASWFLLRRFLAIFPYNTVNRAV